MEPSGATFKYLKTSPSLLFSLTAAFFLQQIARDKLIALGTCIGRFTHTGKFRLTIGCLDVLSQYAKYKVSNKENENKKAFYFARFFCLVRSDARPEDVKAIQSSTRNQHVDSLLYIPTLGLRAWLQSF